MKRLRGIFIGGPGRSGTTIMKKVLCTTPKVARCREELRLVSDPGGLVDLYQVFATTWSPFRGDAAWRRFIKLWQDLTYATTVEGPYHRHSLSTWFPRAYREAFFRFQNCIVTDVSRGRWTGAEVGAGITETRSYVHVPQELSIQIGLLLSRLFSDPWPEAEFFVDDTPELAGVMPFLPEIFPECVCVFMIRHPYDIYASHVQRRAEGRLWLAEKPEASALRVYNSLRTSPRLEPHLIFRLEDLIADPDRFQEQLDLQRGPQISTEGFLRIDADAANIGRFATLSVELQEIGRDVLHPITEKLGYES